MSEALQNPAFESMDELLDASMNDLMDLPPIGVPPTGSYVFEVSAGREKAKEGDGEYIKFNYTVIECAEVKHEEEAEDPLAKAGSTFTEFFSPFKKDGTINDKGLGFLKARLAPFSAHFGVEKVGETLATVNKVQISASLIRTQDKRDETRHNARLSDVIIL